MKTILFSILILWANLLISQINLENLELISMASQAFIEKNFEEAISLNEKIIKIYQDEILNTSYYNLKESYKFILARAFFSKAKAKGYLGRVKEGYFDLYAAESAYPNNLTFSLYKELYKTKFFDDDIDESLFLEYYKAQQRFLNISLVLAQGI